MKASGASVTVLVAFTTVLAACASQPVAVGDRAENPAHKPAPSVSLGPASALYLRSGDLATLFRHAPSASWEPRVNPERMRGGIEVFQKVAGAVVVVQASDGHGTGFLVSSDGLVVTNHHVIEEAFVDTRTSTSYARVYLGRLKDGQIRLGQTSVRGSFLGSDRARDLALLRLEQVPEDFQPLPYLTLAGAPPQPGARCAIVGHPSSGMLWTLRQCDVAAMGQSPRDMVNMLFALLASSPAERTELQAMLDAMDSREIVLSSCLANPGDSGGPLVNENGEVIGVTFAIPAEASEQKFAYHLSLSELRPFLKETAHQPTLLVPDAWRLGPRMKLVLPQVLAAGTDQPYQFLIDLDGDTPQDLISRSDFPRLVGERRFDAEAAWHRAQEKQTLFYDTDGDGRMDLVLVDQDDDPAADRRYTLGAGVAWRVEDDVNVELLDPSVFKDKRLGARFVELMNQLTGR